MKSYALITILLALCLIAPECQKRDPPLTPEQATVARRAIINYLECEECEEGELEAVVKQGPAAVSSLAATLLEGPSRANLETLRRQLVTNYRELKEYERTHPEIEGSGNRGTVRCCLHEEPHRVIQGKSSDGPRGHRWSRGEARAGGGFPQAATRRREGRGQFIS